MRARPGTSRFLRRVPLLLLLVLMPAALAASGATRRLPTYDLGPVTDLVQNAVNGILLSGASLLLVRDGEAIYDQAFGSFTLDAAGPIASGSKWLSAALVMTLVDDGLIALDYPGGRYLAGFAGDVGAITIRQLLSHTSGLPDAHPCQRSGADRGAVPPSPPRLRITHTYGWRCLQVEGALTTPQPPFSPTAGERRGRCDSPLLRSGRGAGGEGTPALRLAPPVGNAWLSEGAAGG